MTIRIVCVGGGYYETTEYSSLGGVWDAIKKGVPIARGRYGDILINPDNVISIQEIT